MSREPEHGFADVFPDTTPLMTIDRFARARVVSGADGELLGAFEHVERLRGPLRKLSREEWINEFTSWRSAPR